MKILAPFYALLALAAAPLLPSLRPHGTHGAVAQAAPEQAVCVVCVVKGGMSEPERVKAVRTYRGVEYAFCSEGCAQEFDADPAAFAAAEFPYPAPEFSLRGLDGAELSSERLRGQVVLLDFWATWCAPCRKAIPELQSLHARNASRGFTVVGISLDEGAKGRANLRRFVKSKKIEYPIALDADSLAVHERFKVKAIPAAYLIDREGHVVARWLGSPAIVEEVEAKLAELLGAPD